MTGNADFCHHRHRRRHRLLHRHSFADYGAHAVKHAAAGDGDDDVGGDDADDDGDDGVVVAAAAAAAGDQR